MEDLKKDEFIRLEATILVANLMTTKKVEIIDMDDFFKKTKQVIEFING
mgnify:CR=1 FL=1